MKILAVLATISAVVLLVVGTRIATSVPVDVAATVELTTGGKNFGTVAPGQRLQGGFPVYNAGSRRLILHQDGASCCGQAASEPLVIPPGQTASVPVDVLAPTRPGPFEQPLSFTTNDPAQPRFDFVVRGVVSQSPSQ